MRVLETSVQADPPLLDLKMPPCREAAGISTQATPKVLFRPFSGIAPQLYKRAFMKDPELKDKDTGAMLIHEPSWGTPWHLAKVSYVEIEARLSEEAPEHA